MAFDLEELPDIARWCQSLLPPANWLTYVSNMVPFSAAVAVGDLLIPQLVEHEGLVLRRAALLNGGLASIVASDKSARQKEALANHLHVWDAFKFADGMEWPDESMEHFAKVLGVGWGAAVASQFPDRSLKVIAGEGYGPTITIARCE
ncbi:MAG: hypothetical protein JWL76_1456 [Thermoleophilia bacterium]|nr:hypothetical protein [Thermoleophilia bacterium]